MKRRLWLVAFIFCGAIFFAQVAVAQSAKKVVFAVFWRGCEEACLGFQHYFNEKNADLDIVIRDADRDKAKLPEFLEEARALKADLILTWGTSASLGIAGTLDDVGNSRFNNEIPQVFTVVADPVGVRLIESLEKTGRSNITGTFNRVPENVNIDTIRAYLPGFKRLGLLYNANEPNSVIKKEEIAKLSEELNFEFVALELPLGDDGKPNPIDILEKMAQLKEQKVDFLYMGSSSFLDDNRDVFTLSAIDNGIPLLSPYTRLVLESSALLAVAAPYYDVGRLAAQQAEKILFEGLQPGDIPVARMTKFSYLVNMAVARQLDLLPPPEFLEFADTVN
jgi:putative ABC transport system substrate-binding protein